jgi:hypothetical protein
LGAELDKMCCLYRRRRKQDSIVGNDSNFEPMDTSKPLDEDQTKHSMYRKGTYSDHGGTVLFLEFSEPATINYSCDHIPHIKRLPNVSANNAMEFRSWVQWFL